MPDSCNPLTHSCKFDNHKRTPKNAKINVNNTLNQPVNQLWVWGCAEVWLNMPNSTSNSWYSQQERCYKRQTINNTMIQKTTCELAERCDSCEPVKSDLTCLIDVLIHVFKKYTQNVQERTPKNATKINLQKTKLWISSEVWRCRNLIEPA